MSSLLYLCYIFACIFFSVQSVSIKCMFNQNSVTSFRAVGRLRLPDKAYVYSCELIELLLTESHLQMSSSQFKY